MLFLKLYLAITLLGFITLAAVNFVVDRKHPNIIRVLGELLLIKRYTLLTLLTAFTPVNFITAIAISVIAHKREVPK